MPLDREDARAQLVTTLLQKVHDDPYPSSTMLDLVESLLTEDELPTYVVYLQKKLRDDRFPSIPMLQRLTALVE